MTTAEQTPEQFPDTVTIPLWKPFDFEGFKQTSVTLHELTVEENLELEKASAGLSTFEQDIRYFAKMAGKPVAFFLAMKERDWKRVKNRYWETLGNVELEPATSE